MSNRECSIEACGKPTRSRGWCNAHYGKWRRYGNPLAGTSRDDRAAPQPERVGDCLVWTGTRNAYGYGTLMRDGRREQAHRAAWEKANGAIPEGMLVDHACHNRACVNAAHLRLATTAENSWNLSGPHRDRKFDLPRGVAPAKSGRFRGYVMRHGAMHAKQFGSAAEADAWVTAKRAELFGAFAGNG